MIIITIIIIIVESWVFFIDKGLILRKACGCGFWGLKKVATTLEMV